VMSNMSTNDQNLTVMSSGRIRRGVYGGTFDPIHYGHLICAQMALEEMDLDQVVFVPAGIPPHKDDQSVAPALDRYNMVVLATQDNPRFVVSRVELERPGPSYTVDTVEELRRVWGDQVDIYFIVGADVVAELPDWHEPERLFQLCQFVAVTRPGYDSVAVEESIRTVQERFHARITLLRTPGTAMSSHEIRARVRSGKSLRYLVPPAVEEYVHSHGLYQGRL